MNKFKSIIYFFLFIIFGFVSINSYSQEKVTINVKDAGAKGDGQTDDYPILLKVADSISNLGGGVVYFPPGVYYIASYRAGKNGITNITFRNCNGLRIYGQNAIISVNGNFHRTMTRQDSRHKYSNISAVIPIRILSCKNVTIEDIEINGNVDKMTRDPGVVEGDAHLLAIYQSQDVYVNNMYLHHAQVDGIYIAGDSAKDIKINNSVSSNNGRQGMSVVQLVNGTFTNCKFINTGITEGQYGNHAPSAGVDVEPNTIQQNVENINFINCLFENNLGSQFVCSKPINSDNIHFFDCTFNSGVNSSRYTIIVNAKNVSFSNCSFDCKNGSIYPVWQLEGSTSIFENCSIKSNQSGFVAVSYLATNSVVIDSCQLQYTGTQKVQAFFPYIRMKNLSFTNNTINIPEEYLKDKGFTGLIQNVSNATNNSLLSDGQLLNSKISYQGSNTFSGK